MDIHVVGIVDGTLSTEEIDVDEAKQRLGMPEADAENVQLGCEVSWSTDRGKFAASGAYTNACFAFIDAYGACDGFPL